MPVRTEIYSMLSAKFIVIKKQTNWSNDRRPSLGKETICPCNDTGEASKEKKEKERTSQEEPLTVIDLYTALVSSIIEDGKAGHGSDKLKEGL